MSGSAKSGLAPNASTSRQASFAWIPPAILLILALVFGGGTYQRSWPDAVVQLGSLPILVVAASLLARRWSERWIRIVLVLAGSVAALPLLQLVPLPPDIWANLPGRISIAEGFREADLDPWLPLSLSPAETWRSFLGLLPPIAMFLFVLGLDWQARRALALFLICCGFVCGLVGLAQIAGGAGGPFRFYGASTAAVGFFINRNHYAALLYATIPFTAAWMVGLAADRRPQMLVGIGLCLLALASLLLGLGMAQSRAGLVLAMLAALASLALARGSAAEHRSKATAFTFIAGFTGILLIVQFAFLGILQRLEADPLEDERWIFARVTMSAAQYFLPFGSGFGTFDSVYKAYETRDMLSTSYVNNAHNDFAELFLEGGVPVVILAAIFLGCFLVRAVQLWTRSPDHRSRNIDLSLGEAAAIVIGLLLLHSFVDYPLRSAALSTIFAFSCALILPPFEPDAHRWHQRRHHRAIDAGPAATTVSKNSPSSA